MKVILASKSARRQQLLRDLGIEFTLMEAKINEKNYPKNLHKDEIPVFLAKEKANSLKKQIKNNEILISADTLVSTDNQILSKPTNYDDAFEMLSKLSDKYHKVVSGVCIIHNNKEIVFNDTTWVHFRKIEAHEIKFYIDKYKPYDKAGAYGIQEWMGMIAIDEIRGSYYNVMGLPINKLYQELKKIDGLKLDNTDNLDICCKK